MESRHRCFSANSFTTELGQRHGPMTVYTKALLRSKWRWTSNVITTIIHYDCLLHTGATFRLNLQVEVDVWHGPGPAKHNKGVCVCTCTCISLPHCCCSPANCSQTWRRLNLQLWQHVSNLFLMCHHIEFRFEMTSSEIIYSISETASCQRCSTLSEPHPAFF